MNTLDAINSMLATRGISPVSNVSQSRTVTTAVQLLEAVRREHLARGWWFNSETRELTPHASDGRVYIPTDYLSVQDTCGRYVSRGRVLYDVADGTDLIPSPVTLRVVRDALFEDIPELVSAYIAADARFRYQRDYDGDSTKTRELSIELQRTQAAAVTEEIRQRQVNLLLSNPTVQYIHRRRSHR